MGEQEEHPAFFFDLILLQIANIFCPISVQTGVHTQIEGVKKKINTKNDNDCRKILEQYKESRKPLELATKNGRVQLPLYQESRSYLEANASKEPELMVSMSIFGKVRSVLSMGSMMSKDDREIADVLDILRQ